jgi:hypothetical protein
MPQPANLPLLPPQYVARTEVLRIRAFYVGKVSTKKFERIFSERLQPYNPSETQQVDLSPAKLNLPTQDDQATGLPYVGGGTGYNARWRTLCADTFHNEQPPGDSVYNPSVTSSALFRRAREDDHDAFAAWREWILANPENADGIGGHSAADAAIARMDKAVHNHSVFDYELVCWARADNRCWMMMCSLF